MFVDIFSSVKRGMLFYSGRKLRAVKTSKARWFLRAVRRVVRMSWLYPFGQSDEALELFVVLDAAWFADAGVYIHGIGLDGSDSFLDVFRIQTACENYGSGN